MRLLIIAAAAASALAFGSVANATTIMGLYSTGTTNGGAVLSDGSSDPHYLVNVSGVPVVYNNAAYVGASTAAFISVQADGGYTTPVNTYTLDFTLPTKFASAQISGNFEADNYASVFLNGQLIGQDVQGTVYPNFQSETAFSTTTGFVSGVNVLTFKVTDTGPPSALEVSGLSGTVSAVPEPSTWLLMLAGIGAIGLMLRRAKTTGGFKQSNARTA